MGMSHSELSAIVIEIAEAAGYEILVIKFVDGNVVRVWLDSPSGVGADDTAKLSRLLRGTFEERELDAGDYQFELQSPGLDRPLVRAPHFERFAGEEIQVRLRERRVDRKNFKGVLKGIDPEGVVSVQGDELWEFALEEIQEARLVPNFNRLLGKQPAPARTRKPKKARKPRRKKPKRR